jgi:hypothetical protein
MSKANKFAKSERTQQALEQHADTSSLEAMDKAIYEGAGDIDWNKISQQAKAKTIQTQQGQIMVGDFTLTNKGATWDGEPSHENWQQALAVTFRLESGLQWIIGDLIAFGNTFGYGDEKAVAELFGKKPQTLYNYASVCRSFAKISRRRENLTFGHHEAVTGVDNEQRQDQLLDQAEAKGWSVAQLRHETKQLPATVDEDEILALKIQRRRMTKINRYLAKVRMKKLTVQGREKALGEIAAARRWLDEVEGEIKQVK